MNMHSFINSQLPASIFQPRLIYPWQSCKYTVPILINQFNNVLTVNFSIGLECCMVDEACQSSAILKCAHCRAFICADYCIFSSTLSYFGIKRLKNEYYNEKSDITSNSRWNKNVSAGFRTRILCLLALYSTNVATVPSLSKKVLFRIQCFLRL